MTRPSLLKGDKGALGALAMLVLVVVATGLKQPRFLGRESIDSVLLYLPLLTVLGMGQMLVIVTRGIDVSVGSIVGVAAMVVGMTFRAHPGLSVALGLLEGLGVGLLLGCVNAAAIAWGRVPPIVATLGTLSAYRGLTFIVGGGKQIDSNDLPDALTRLSLNGPVPFLPWALLLALAVAGATALSIGRTRTGRNVFALGSNPEAARLRGTPVVRTTFLVYAVSGALAGLAGVLYASRYGFVNPATAGQGLELSVIAAVVIGGTKVVGGSGSVLGVLLGSLLLATMSVALSVLGIDATWQGLAYGLVILVALILGRALRGAA